ncbi:MAG: type II toxin-antitoxin system VapC family toxin, partial [Gemmatimonadales bacterium]
YHARAIATATSHARSRGTWVSSVLVADEFHRLLLYRGGRAAARAAVTRLLADPSMRWLPVSAELVSAAVSAWIDRFHDQDFSLADAVSFELMRREKISEAFAFDRHFVVAGYGVLA